MRIPALLVSLFLVFNAHATPAVKGDALDQFLVDQGLLARLDQVRQSVGNKAAELVVTAMGFLGAPYRRGGNTVESGFDCSGFVKAMFEQTAGPILPRKAEQQAAIPRPRGTNAFVLNSLQLHAGSGAAIHVPLRSRLYLTRPTGTPHSDVLPRQECS